MLPQSIIFISPVKELQEQSFSSWIRTQLPNLPNSAITWINTELLSVSIEDIRALQKQSIYSIHSNTKQFFVILNADSMGKPAQNALLKLLEEPPTGVHIVLIVSQTQALVSTILSRSTIIDTTITAEYSVSPEVEELYTTIRTVSFGQLVTVCEKYTTKEDSLHILMKLLKYLYHSISKSTLVNQSVDNNDKTYLLYSKDIQIVLKTLELVKGNGNARLAVEHCFFEIRKNHV